jgi:hypothetical protein
LLWAVIDRPFRNCLNDIAPLIIDWRIQHMHRAARASLALPQSLFRAFERLRILIKNLARISSLKAQSS